VRGGAGGGGCGGAPGGALDALGERRRGSAWGRCSELARRRWRRMYRTAAACRCHCCCQVPVRMHPGAKGQGLGSRERGGGTPTPATSSGRDSTPQGTHPQPPASEGPPAKKERSGPQLGKGGGWAGQAGFRVRGAGACKGTGCGGKAVGTHPAVYRQSTLSPRKGSPPPGRRLQAAPQNRRGEGAVLCLIPVPSQQYMRVSGAPASCKGVCSLCVKLCMRLALEPLAQTFPKFSPWCPVLPSCGGRVVASSRFLKTDIKVLFAAYTPFLDFCYQPGAAKLLPFGR